ncbi:MAG: hypothetical protein EOO47_11635 [Flavobacterium sp.]|nr:MAG: hypothetical protein EOO47_11635 [Flavobacterium sp.]
MDDGAVFVAVANALGIAVKILFGLAKRKKAKRLKRKARPNAQIGYLFSVDSFRFTVFSFN